MQTVLQNISVVCLTGTLCLFVAGCDEGTTPPATGSNEVATPANVPPPVDTIPDTPPEQPESTVEVSLKDADIAGYKTALAQHKGKVVFVDFWATWCSNCRKAFPHTVTWNKELPAEDFAVISVSVDEPSDEVKEEAISFLKEQEAKFTNLISSYEDPDEAFELFEIPDGALPHYKLFGRDGKLIRTFGIDSKEKWGPKDVEAAIKAAIAKK